MFSRSKKTDAVTDEQAMQQIMLLLEEWKSPDPSPWFDARMMARFREEQARAPQGLFAKLRDRWLFSDAMPLKPLMAGAMALLIVAGGGGYWQAEHSHAGQMAGVSATVHDLQELDSNDQTLQQMSQLLDDNDDSAPQS